MYLKFDLKNREGIVRISNPPASASNPSTQPLPCTSPFPSSKKLCRSCSVDIEDPVNHSTHGTPRTKVESPKSLKNIPVKQISFDDSMNLKGSKTSLSSVGLQFTIDPGLIDSNHTTSSTSSRKSSIKSIIIDKIKIVKRVNSESECACHSGTSMIPPNGWRTRSVSLASSSPASNANNPNHVFVRSISKLKLRNDSSFDANSQISLPRLESHHSSSDEDWFEQVEEKIIAIAGPDSETDSTSERGKKSKRKPGAIGDDNENFGSTSCFRMSKYQMSEQAPLNNNTKPTKSSNSKLTNIMNALRKQHRNSIIREEDVEKLGASSTLGESREKSDKIGEKSDEVEKGEKEIDERTDDELIESGKRKKKKRKKRKDTEEGERRKTCHPCCSVS